jgi:two-component system chemotaxis family response regulator WspR
MAQMCLRAGIWTVLLFAPLVLLVREAMSSAQLSLSNTALQDAVRTDPLTGLGNRLRLNEDLAVLTASLSRSGRRACVIILDLDHFKLVNDLSGHLAGDEALRAVAAALRAGSRTSDRLYRYGGEEFLVLTEDGDPGGADILANRLVEAVAEAAIPHPGNAPYDVVTISAGFALIEPFGPEPADLALRTADAGLYAAKAAGRNRVASSLAA